MKIIVDTSKRILRIDGREYACAIGKNGVVPACDGREGDGKTPLGSYQIRYGMYRANKVALPTTKLVFWPIRPFDGWCDAPEDPAYNRPVRLLYPASTETLWRDSGVYDIIIVLGHNDTPPKPEMGSAVFLHVAREGYAPTEGCVAVSKDDILALIAELNANTEILIE